MLSRLLLLLSFVAVPALAQQATPQAGWTREGHTRSGQPNAGVVVPGGYIGMSSPVVAEVDGNLGNGPEVVVGAADGKVHAYRRDGSLVWSVLTPNASCGTAGNRVLSSPAVGDLFGNGQPHVVIGYGGFGTGCTGGVIAIRGGDGSLAWDFNLKAFARKRKFSEAFSTVFATPALADVDFDGKLEIGFGGFDRNVYLLNADGSVRWYYNAADTVFSSPAFANVDNDRDLEMIIGTDISANKRLKPVTKNGGLLYALKTKPLKTESRRHTFRSKEVAVWYRAFDQVLQSSPAVADVDPGNPGDEIIIASGCYFPERTLAKTGRWIKVVRPKDGRVLQTFNTVACSNSSVAIGDVDEDGINEVIATVNGATGVGGDGVSRIAAYKIGSRDPIWSVVPYDRGRNDPYGGTWQSPVVADLDGNGSLEVLAANGASIGVFRGKDGTALSCQSEGCSDKRPYTLQSVDRLKATPAVADLDGDGDLEVIIGGGIGGGKGALFAWTNFAGSLGSAPGVHPPFATPWPLFRGNSLRQGHR